MRRHVQIWPASNSANINDTIGFQKAGKLVVQDAKSVSS